MLRTFSERVVVHGDLALIAHKACQRMRDCELKWVGASCCSVVPRGQPLGARELCAPLCLTGRDVLCVEVVAQYAVLRSYVHWVRVLCWGLFCVLPVCIVILVIVQEARCVAAVDVAACVGVTLVGLAVQRIGAYCLAREARRQAYVLLEFIKAIG